MDTSESDPSPVPPPIDDEGLEIPEQSPPAGGWDTEQLRYELMREESCSYGQAERLLARLRTDYSLGQIRSLIDRRVLGRPR